MKVIKKKGGEITVEKNEKPTEIFFEPKTLEYYKAKEREIKKELVKQGFYKSEKDMGEIKRLSEHINFHDDTVGVQFGERRFLVLDGKIEEITKSKMIDMSTRRTK